MCIYLDNAATTRVCDEAAAAAVKIMTELYGNPSSIHTMGREAKAALEKARKNISDALDCAQTSEIVFTSGGTESDNLAIFAGARLMSRRGRHIISSLAEHEAVLNSLTELERKGWEITRLAPNSDGSVNPCVVAKALRPDTALVSLMMVNNETSAITNIQEVSHVLKTSGSQALLHTDAIQAFLKIPFSAKNLGADMISVSAHKIHGPKGVGALCIKKGLKLKPVVFGGDQEGGLRSGTEGLPQIVAFGEAAKIGAQLMEISTLRMSELRAAAVRRICVENPSALIIGGGAPHILSLSMPGYKSEVIMNFLESRGIFVSKSSACSKGRRSHVLEAMGLKGHIIDGAIRVSLSRFTTTDEINRFCDAVKEASETLCTSLRRN